MAGTNRLRGVYVHPEDLKALDIGTKRDTNDDILARYCVEASRDFETMSGGRIFLPRYYQRHYDFDHDDSTVLRLRDDLLEVDTFTTNNGNTTVASSNYFLYSGSQHNLLPYNKIEMNEGGSTTVLNYSSTPQQANAVTGWWGYIPHWSTDAWIDSGDSISSASGTTITVSDVAGLNEEFTARFKRLNIIKWTVGSDTEHALILDIDEDNNQLKVIRAINGSTSTTPVGSESIDVFVPDDTVTKAVRRLATWYYRQRNSSSPDNDRPIVTVAGIVTPPGMPHDVVEAAKTFRSSLH